MRRDMHLVLEVLRKVEAEELYDLTALPAEQVAQILYHQRLVKEAGFAEGIVLEGDGQLQAVKLTRLTWEGHDLLAQLTALNLTRKGA